MRLITEFLLLILAGQSTCEYTLSCPYENSTIYATRPRVWCKEDAKNKSCCTGFSFQRGTTDLESGKVKVKDDGKSFTISLEELSQGDGTYWCGIMAKDNTIIKIAEAKFPNNQINFVWSILRWILFLFLSLMTISVHIYSNRKHGDTKTT